MERTARLEELKIALPEPLGGREELSAVLGIPEWWPTGSRVAMVLAHGAETDLDDPLLQHIQLGLTERKFLTLRFNFPFAEGRRRSKKIDSPAVLARAFRTAIAVMGRDPMATPAHLFVAGVGLGAGVAASLAAEVLPIEGACLLGLPLHPPGEPEALQAEALYRVVSPILFVQGAEDPTCEIPVLQRVLSRVGAPTALHVSRRLSQDLRPVENTPESCETAYEEVFEAVSGWLSKTLKEE